MTAVRLTLCALVALIALAGAAAAPVRAAGPVVQPLGDQVTYGNAAHPSAYRDSLGQRAALAGRPMTQRGTVTDPQGLKHDGHLGANLAALTQDAPGYLAAVHPDAVLILAGGNDILTGVTPATALARLGQLLDAVAAAGVTGRAVIVATIPDADRSAAIRANISAYNAGVAQLAAQRGHRLADVYAGWDVATDLENDGATPNGSGLVKIATAMLAAWLA